MSNQYYFFGTRTTFIQAVPKIFCRVNGALINSSLVIPADSFRSWDSIQDDEAIMFGLPYFHVGPQPSNFE